MKRIRKLCTGIVFLSLLYPPSLVAAVNFTFPPFPTLDFSACGTNACMRSVVQAGFDAYLQTAASSLGTQLNANFGDYASSLGQHYGNVALLTGHSLYPIGKDNMGIFPSFYGGLGVGLAFADVGALNQDAPDGMSDLSMLPAFGLSFNTGFGLSRKWDLRLGFFPLVDFAMPPDLSSEYTATLNYGAMKAKLGYHVLEGGLFQPGLTLSGYASFSGGTLGITAAEEAYNDITIAQGTGTDPTFTGTVKPTYQWSANAKWRYYGLGAEARIWYDLLFVVPYFGVGTGLNMGSFTTSFNLDADVLMTGATVDADGTNPGAAEAVADMTSTAAVKFAKKVRPDILLHRVFLGLEMHIVLVTIGTELQFDISNHLMGASFGAALQF